MKNSQKPEIFFNCIGSSGPLSIYWYEGPYGDAKDCKFGEGHCWMTSNGELLGVQFDDVDWDNDHQVLTIDEKHKVEIQTKNGKVTIFSKTDKPHQRKRKAG